MRSIRKPASANGPTSRRTAIRRSFMARGAHASYFKTGEHWNDRADGGRPSPTLVLEIVTDRKPGWITWPGAWGDTQAESTIEGQSSPHGPCRHGQWKHPDALIPRAAAVATRPPVAPRPPHPELVAAERRDDKLRVNYAFPGGDLGGARSLLVTINSPDDQYPPATYTLPVTRGTGSVE